MAVMNDVEMHELLALQEAINRFREVDPLEEMYYLKPEEPPAQRGPPMLPSLEQEETGL